MARKIMVFEERINNYDEKIKKIETKESICAYCNKLKNLDYEVINVAFFEPYYICKECFEYYDKN